MEADSVFLQDRTEAEYFLQKGHSITVIAGSEVAKQEERALLPSGMHAILLPVKLIGFGTVRFPYVPRLVPVLSNLSLDIIHLNSHLHPTAIQTLRAVHRMRRPLVVTVHGVLAKRGVASEILQRVWLHLVGRLLWRNATVVLCLTSSDASELRRYGCPRSKIRIIPNGVDVNRFRATGSLDGNVLVWAGRFVPEKGLIYLVEALHLVAKRYPAVRLVMAGDGPERERISHLVRQRGLDANVSFLGSVSWSRMPEVFNSGSIFLIPSLKEGMPYALLEAMACARAIVASSIPAMRSLLTHRKEGLLVPPGDPRALADAITELLADPGLRKRLGRASREYVESRHAHEVIAKELEQVYLEAMRTK